MNKDTKLERYQSPKFALGFTRVNCISVCPPITSLSFSPGPKLKTEAFGC